MVDVAPGILDQVAPLSVLSCHWTAGVGDPLAAAEKLAVCPAMTVWSAGWVVTEGAELTVNKALLVVAEPAELVNTAWYCLPLSAD